MNHKPKYNILNYKPVKSNIKKYFCYLGLGKDFLEITSNIWAIKELINWTSSKLKTAFWETLLGECKKNPQSQKINFQNHIFNEGIEALIYKDLM